MLKLSSRQKRGLALSQVMAATLYISFIVWTGYEEIARATARLGWTGWLLLLGCSLGNYLLLLNSGADMVTAVAIPLISRLSTLWFAVVLGLISSLLIVLGEKNDTG